jgi:hypothetical protein
MAKDTFSKDLDAWVKSQDINAKGKKEKAVAQKE